MGHTRGHWTAIFHALGSNKPRPGGPIIWSDAGKIIARISEPPGQTHSPRTEYAPASDEIEPNGYLLAAAPIMLQTLVKAKITIKNDRDLDVVIKDLDYAIRKARGLPTIGDAANEVTDEELE